MSRRIARVFPRRTEATPDDDLAFVGPPPLLTPPEVDEVHVSVTFTYDKAVAEDLAYQWGVVGVPVKLGGPAYDDPGGEFIPGMYVKPGYVMNSRGCNNNCWFCSVPKREGPIREIPVTDGHNVLDSNLLQCSEAHVREVCAMLAQQSVRPIFTGGLEARMLKPWQAELLREIRTQRLYCAYDTPDDYEPLVDAGRIFRAAGFTTASHALACYALIGYRGDTFEKAEKRLIQTIKAGFVPYAMLFRDEKGETDQTWRAFQREWCRPQIVGAKLKEYAART